MFIKNIFRNSFPLLILISLLILNTGCDKELDEIDDNTVMKKLSIQEEELINSTNDLSLRILNAEFQKNDKANYFFSPVSVSMALGMVYNVVGEKEKSTILHNTGLDYLAGNEINKSYNELLSFLNSSKLHTNISYANSIWFSPELNINEDFRTTVMAYYDAEIEELNFKRNSAFETVNRWGNLKTHGKFETIVDGALPNNSSLLFINAFGLNTSWNRNNSSFLTKSNFTNIGGETSDVQTINFDGIELSVNDSEDFTFYEFPMEDKTYNFSLIVPSEAEKINDLLESLSADDLNNLHDNSYSQKANLSFPNINFSGNKSLKSCLSSIGLNCIFSEKADLTPSFTEKSFGQIDDMNQNAQIVLSHQVPQGIKTNFSDLNLKQLDVNRPFVYFVRDKLTKTVLFAGYFVSPESN